MSETSDNSAPGKPELTRTSGGKRGKHVALLVFAFVACFSWILLTRLHTADEPLERDICTQIMMGRVLAEGGKMYIDTIEFKPPGMFVIWQIIHQLVGTSPRVVLWVNILATTLTMIGVFLAGSVRPGGRSGGIWAMCFWTLIGGDMMLQANQPNNEVFMNLFMIGGIALWVRADSAQAGRGHYAAAGLLLGLVTLIKPVLVTVVCMAVAWVLAEGVKPAALRRRAWAVRWVLVPIAASWGLMVLYFAWDHRAGILYDCLVRYAVFYAGQDTSGIGMNILNGLREKLIPSYMVFLAPLMALTALGIWGGRRGRDRPQALTLVGCLIGTFLAVSIPGRFYPHYYQLYLPILAVGAGWGIATLANSLDRRLVAQGIGAGTLALLLWHIVPDYRYTAKTWSLIKYQTTTYIETERCGRAVNQMLTADEPFYVWGADPGCYYYSDRRPASGIFWADRLLFGPLQAQATQKVIADLEKTQPPLILIECFIKEVELHPDHPVGQWILENYVQSPEARFSRLFNVFIHRDSALAFRLSTNQKPFALTLADVDPLFLIQIGRVDEAIVNLQKSIKIDPDYPEDHKNLGVALSRKRQFNKAIAHYREALRLAPNYAEAHYNLGNALAAQGQLAEAMTHFRQALRLQPDFAQAHNNLGLALRQQRQPAEAIVQLREALRLDPDYAEAHYNLGAALAAQGQLAEAMTHFRQALRLRPDFAEAHFSLGLALRQQRQPAEAIVQLREALRLNPDYAETHHVLGLALMDLGQPAEAIAHFREALRLQPDYAEAHNDLGIALAAQGHYAEAIAQHREVLRRQPDQVVALNSLAWVLATAPEAGLRDSAGAVRAAERAGELTGHKDPSLLDTLAAAYAEAGRFVEAVATAREAASLATAQGQKELAAQIGQRAALYEKQQPYREPPSARPDSRTK